MVFNATFNNVSVLLVEDTGVPWQTGNLQTLSHNVVRIAWARCELTTLVVIGTDCISGYKSNYHTITNTTGPRHVQLCSFGLRFYIMYLSWWHKSHINQYCNMIYLNTIQYYFPIVRYKSTIAQKQNITHDTYDNK
jgi:hypothetical protein